MAMPMFTKNIHDIDLERFKEHISWLIDEGLVNGRGILMGGSGQSAAYLMTREQHESTMKALVDAANGRVPTMTGIFDIRYRRSSEKSEDGSGHWCRFHSGSSLRTIYHPWMKRYTTIIVRSTTVVTAA